MPSRHDVCITFRPDQQTANGVATELERAIEMGSEDLEVESSWSPTWDSWRQRFDFVDEDGSRVGVEIEAGRAYFYGSTHSSKEWQAWVLAILGSGIGDGQALVVYTTETENPGMGWLYEWDAPRHRIPDSQPPFLFPRDIPQSEEYERWVLVDFFAGEIGDSVEPVQEYFAKEYGMFARSYERWELDPIPDHLL